LGGDSSFDNLILLCPNCHTDYHKVCISRNELIIRKKKISGKINRSFGNLNIQGNPTFIVGGTKYIGIEKILDGDDI